MDVSDDEKKADKKISSVRAMVRSSIDMSFNVSVVLYKNETIFNLGVILVILGVCITFHDTEHKPTIVGLAL